MKIVSDKILLLILISFSVLLIKSDNSTGCGWYPEPDSYYSIFVPELFNLPALKPFFLSENEFFDFNKTSSLGEKTDNLKEWVKYFKDIPTIDDVDKIIYSSNKDDIENIIQYFKDSSEESIAEKYNNNTLFSYLQKHNHKDFLDYLHYIKSCTQYVQVPDSWENSKRDTTGIFNSIRLGKEKLLACKNIFIKDRYAFQVIRLLHYSGRYEEAINYYDNQFKKEKNSLIKYWALEHKAGCLYRLKEKAQANYLFAKIFEECLSRRTHCIHSFSCNSDSLLDATLSLCRNADEKASVIMLNAYKRYGEDVSAMDEIYKLDPKSDYLELLLQRGISIMEREIIPPTYNNLKFYDYNYDFKTYIDEPLTEFGNLVKKIARENKTKHPYLWYFAAGYISTMTHHNNKAEELYVKAKQLCPKENLDIINRIKIVEVINDVDGCKFIDAKAEADMLPGLRWLRKTPSLERLKSEEAFYYIAALLRAKYLAQNDTVKANLCTGIRVSINDWYNRESAFGYDIRRDFYKEPLQKIYNMITSGKLSPFDKFLVDNYLFNNNQLRELIATKYLAKHEFNKAQKLLSFGPGFTPRNEYEEHYRLDADPFIIHINDCHDCDFKVHKDTIYTKLTFTKRMIELLKLTENDKNNAAHNYYLLANGFYNMTFFGNSWQFVSYYRNSPNLPKEFYDCSTAKEYYIKAMNTTKDKELAAECCFMASKCDQNKFYTEKYSYDLLKKNPDKYFEIKDRYRGYFRKLIEKYSDTKFYQEALKECKYFNLFVNQN